MSRPGTRIWISTGRALSALALLSTCVTLALAQETEAEETAESPFSGWTCRLCPETEEGWLGLAAFGLGWVSDDSLRYGTYRGLEDEGVYAPLDIEGEYRAAEGRWAEVSGRDLALDSRELELRGGREGKYELRASWNEIPTWRGFGAQTPFEGQGSDTLTLPEDWVDATTTAGMTALQGSLQPAPMKIQRKTLDAGATIRFAGDWSVEVDAQRQDKSGTRPFGGAGIFYNNAAQILAPVDFTTDSVELGLNWTRERFQLSLGFTASEFDNGRHSLTWDNPFTGTPEVSRFRAALEPSNEFYQFSLTGAWAIAPGIHVSGYGSIGEMSQDEAFLPYSINPDFGDLVLPRSSLDGKVDTSVANVGGKFFARLNSRLSIHASAKYDERDNRTPVDVYTPVTTDFIVLGERKNRPYGFERTKYEADLRFRAMRKLRLGGGVRYQELDRTLQAIEESDETTWWGEAKFTPFSRSHLRVTFESGSRDTSEYRVLDDDGRPDHPLFRKFNQADRDRSRAQLEGFYATTAGLGVNLTLYGADDDYEESVLGLQSSEVRGGTLSLDYAFNPRTSVYGFVSREDIESVLFGRDGSLAWTGTTKDEIATAGAGFSTSIDPDMEVGIDLIWADTEGKIDVQANNDEPFPNLKTTLKNVRLRFDHSVTEEWAYRLYVEFESFDSSDWAFDGIGVDGVDAVLTYGIISPRYDIWNLSAQAIYRF